MAFQAWVWTLAGCLGMKIAGGGEWELRGGGSSGILGVWPVSLALPGRVRSLNLPFVTNSCFIDAQTLAQHCAELASDKKAEDIVIMDLRGVSDVADFYVICTAFSDPQLKAVRDHIIVEMRDQHGERPARVEGETDSGWIIIDYSNIMVHVLHREKRELYALEQLWNDAPVVRYDAAGVPMEG